MDDTKSDDYEDDDYEINPIFTYSECTCEHNPESHGWIKCDIIGCNCEAAWEE